MINIKKLFALVIVLIALGSIIPSIAYSGVAEDEAAVWKAYKDALKDGSPEKFRQVIRKIGDVMRAYPAQTNIEDMLFLLGLCYENSFEFKKALLYYKELRDVHPYSKNTNTARYKIGLIDSANNDDEKSSLVLFVQQERLMMAGEHEEAVEKCKKLIEQKPSSILADNAQNVIGYILFNNLKKYNSAVKEYEKLLKLFPASSFRDNAIFAIGRCYEEMGHYASAMRQYEKLMNKHKGLFFAKTDYWARVWYTKAEDQAKGLAEKMDAAKYRLCVMDSLVTPKRKFCASNKHGSFDKTNRFIMAWIKTDQIKKIATEELQLSEVEFFRNDLDTAQTIINYVLGTCPYAIAPGSQDYWQFPEETVKLKTGDDADLSFLMASLLIASGVNPANVWVIMGMDQEGDIHYWVNIFYNEEWYTLQPFWDPPFEEIPLAKFETGYTVYCAFNNKSVKINPRVNQIFPECN